MTHKGYRRLFRYRFGQPDPAEVDEEFQFHLVMRARELEAQGTVLSRRRTGTVVVTVNYPLQYMAERIGGPDVQAVLPRQDGQT